MDQTPALFRPIKLGRITLQHRVVLAPLTRHRVHANTHVPGPQQATYYAQRSSTPGTLLITEATLVSHDAGGRAYVPGIYTNAQIQAWKKVTEAVHAQKSYIFLQLWALGRTAEINVLEKQDPASPYVTPSPVALKGRPKPPLTLTEDEIQAYIAAYANAAHNAAYKAGFDGMEVHGAHGYLIDQFLQSVSNTRIDRWGGDEEGRTRFAREVVDAVVGAVGADRVGLRISPWNTYQGMRMPDPRPTFAYLVTAVRDKHPTLAYLHVVEPRLELDLGMDPASIEGAGNDFLREIWDGGDRVFVSAGGHTRETALCTAKEKGGLVAFGRNYISNMSLIAVFLPVFLLLRFDLQPYLPDRLRKDLHLTQPDRSKFYIDGNLTPFGYTDWPFADRTVKL